MKNILNLTPHPVCIIGKDGSVVMRFAPEPVAARYGSYVVTIGDINGIPLTKTEYTRMYNLPNEIPDTYFIVSRMTAQLNPTRHDLLVPNEQVRDETGRVIGCRSLELN